VEVPRGAELHDNGDNIGDAIINITKGISGIGFSGLGGLGNKLGAGTGTSSTREQEMTPMGVDQNVAQ
jgi:hypothetical protein